MTATLTGVSGTGVATGSRAKTMSGAEFQSTSDVTLQPSPGVSVEMESVDTGPVAAAAGTLTEIVTVIPGWETITNPSAAVPGTNRQGDPDYRSTYRTRTAHRSTGALDALRGCT